MKIHPFNISSMDIDGEKVQRSGQKKKNCLETRNDESCRSGKWNAAALYSIVSPKFIFDGKKKKKRIEKRKSYFPEAKLKSTKKKEKKIKERNLKKRNTRERKLE